MDENGNDISFSTVCDDSFNALLHGVTSTPRRGAIFQRPLPQVQRRPSKAVQKVLKRQRLKEKEKVACPICGRQYVNASALRNHKRLHAIESAASKFPNKEMIMSHLPSIVLSTLNKIVDSLLPCEVTDYATEFTQLVDSSNLFQEFTKQVCYFFVSAIESKKFLLPSKLLEALVKETDRILSDIPLRCELVVLLSLSRKECDVDILHLFLCQYVIFFCEELLKFISASVCEKPTFSKKYECDDEDRQTLDYIGGAILKSFHKKAKRYPTSNVWRSIKDAIAHRMIESDSVEGPCSEDKSWTNARDRGGLLHVSDDCLEFLVCLAEIIENSEEPDGSLSYLKVYEKVCNSMAMTVYWDSMISDSLSESISSTFLRCFTKSCCQTFGNGITRRRMNSMNEAPMTSISLRHQVVSRKVRVK